MGERTLIEQLQTAADEHDAKPASARVPRLRWPTGHMEVSGLKLGDSVVVTSEREGFDGVTGVLTGFASGKGLDPYFRVRIYVGRSISSPWFTRDELDTDTATGRESGE